MTLTPQTQTAEEAAASLTNRAETAEETRRQLIDDVFGTDFSADTLAPSESSPVGTGEEGVAAPAAAPSQPAADPAGSAPAVQQSAPPAAQPQEPANPAPQPSTPVDEKQLRIAALERELAEARGTQAPEAQPAAQPQGPPAFDINKPEVLPVQLPDAVLQQIFGEDPVQAASAINGVLSAVVSSALHRARAEFHYHLNDIRTSLGSRDSAAEQQQAEQVAEERRNGYFAKFPHHQAPPVQAILRDETAKLAGELGPGASWDDNFVAALGARVDGVLAAMGVQLPGPGNPTATQGQPAPAAAAPSQPAGRPAAMMPTGSRPAPEQVSIVEDTFSWD